MTGGSSAIRGGEPFFWLSVRRPALGARPETQGRARRQPFTEDNMMERLLALLLAGALVAPQVGQANESALTNDSARPVASKFPEKLPLPPIPYLDTMPWMNFGSESKGPGIDTLWLPDFDAPAWRKTRRLPTTVSGMLNQV
jgi:hypothetical protein